MRRMGVWWDKQDITSMFDCTKDYPHDNDQFCDRQTCGQDRSESVLTRSLGLGHFD